MASKAPDDPIPKRLRAAVTEIYGDRVARSTKQLIETIEKPRVKGFGFRSQTEAFDTTTTQGRIVFHMFSALAEFERSVIRERTEAGLAAARRRYFAA